MKKQTPHGTFYGGRKCGKYVFHGMGSQKLVFESHKEMPPTLTVDEVSEILATNKSAEYFPLGSLF